MWTGCTLAGHVPVYTFLANSIGERTQKHWGLSKTQVTSCDLFPHFKQMFTFVPDFVCVILYSFPESGFPTLYKLQMPQTQICL